MYAEMYSITNPVILSPYSHKSFLVVYDKEIEREDLEFCFEENGIKAIEDSNLFWNLKREIILNRTYDSKIPYGADIRYKYF